jgi:hypothetical protein
MQVEEATAKPRETGEPDRNLKMKRDVPCVSTRNLTKQKG